MHPLHTHATFIFVIVFVFPLRLSWSSVKEGRQSRRLWERFFFLVRWKRKYVGSELGEGGVVVFSAISHLHRVVYPLVFEMDLDCTCAGGGSVLPGGLGLLAKICVSLRDTAFRLSRNLVIHHTAEPPLSRFRQLDRPAFCVLRRQQGVGVRELSWTGCGYRKTLIFQEGLAGVSYPRAFSRVGLGMQYLALLCCGWGRTSKFFWFARMSLIGLCFVMSARGT